MHDDDPGSPTIIIPGQLTALRIILHYVPTLVLLLLGAILLLIGVNSVSLSSTSVVWSEVLAPSFLLEDDPLHYTSSSKERSSATAYVSRYTTLTPCSTWMRSGEYWLSQNASMSAPARAAAAPSRDYILSYLEARLHEHMFAGKKAFANQDAVRNDEDGDAKRFTASINQLFDSLKFLLTGGRRWGNNRTDATVEQEEFAPTPTGAATAVVPRSCGSQTDSECSSGLVVGEFGHNGDNTVVFQVSCPSERVTWSTMMNITYMVSSSTRENRATRYFPFADPSTCGTDAASVTALCDRYLDVAMYEDLMPPNSTTDTSPNGRVNVRRVILVDGDDKAGAPTAIQCPSISLPVSLSAAHMDFSDITVTARCSSAPYESSFNHPDVLHARAYYTTSLREVFTRWYLAGAKSLSVSARDGSVTERALTLTSCVLICIVSVGFAVLFVAVIRHMVSFRVRTKHLAQHVEMMYQNFIASAMQLRAERRERREARRQERLQIRRSSRGDEASSIPAPSETHRPASNVSVDSEYHLDDSAVEEEALSGPDRAHGDFATPPVATCAALRSSDCADSAPPPLQLELGSLVFHQSEAGDALDHTNVVLEVDGHEECASVTQPPSSPCSRARAPSLPPSLSEGSVRLPSAVASPDAAAELDSPRGAPARSTSRSSAAASAAVTAATPSHTRTVTSIVVLGDSPAGGAESGADARTDAGLGNDLVVTGTVTSSIKPRERKHKKKKNKRETHDSLQQPSYAVERYDESEGTDDCRRRHPKQKRRGREASIGSSDDNNAEPYSAPSCCRDETERSVSPKSQRRCSVLSPPTTTRHLEGSLSSVSAEQAVNFSNNNRLVRSPPHRESSLTECDNHYTDNSRIHSHRRPREAPYGTAEYIPADGHLYSASPPEMEGSRRLQWEEEGCRYREDSPHGAASSEASPPSSKIFDSRALGTAATATEDGTTIIISTSALGDHRAPTVVAPTSHNQNTWSETSMSLPNKKVSDTLGSPSTENATGDASADYYKRQGNSTGFSVASDNNSFTSSHSESSSSTSVEMDEQVAAAAGMSNGGRGQRRLSYLAAASVRSDPRQSFGIPIQSHVLEGSVAEQERLQSLRDYRHTRGSNTHPVYTQRVRFARRTFVFLFVCLVIVAIAFAAAVISFSLTVTRSQQRVEPSLQLAGLASSTSMKASSGEKCCTSCPSSAITTACPDDYQPSSSSPQRLTLDWQYFFNNTADHYRFRGVDGAMLLALHVDPNTRFLTTSILGFLSIIGAAVFLIQLLKKRVW